MGYAHIPNLYKDQTILMFKQCYAMEKIHGTSAHISFKRQTVDLSTPEKCAEEFLRDKQSTISPTEFGQIICESGRAVNELTAEDMKIFVLILREKYSHVDIKDFHSLFNAFCTMRNQFAGWDIRIFSGGAKHDQFVALFDLGDLAKRMNDHKYDELTVYGEACGGKIQKMSHAYGNDMRFIAFEVQIGEYWLTPPAAWEIVSNLGLDFVDFGVVSTKLSDLDAIRDAPSALAMKLGLGRQQREGVVLRPLIEVKKPNGERIIAKHKAEAFCETASRREINVDAIKTMQQNNDIASEWVTEMRLNHVIDNVASCLNLDMDELDIKHTPDIIKGMIADVYKEGDDIPDTKEMRQALSQKAVQLWKGHLAKRLAS